MNTQFDVVWDGTGYLLPPRDGGSSAQEMVDQAPAQYRTAEYNVAQKLARRREQKRRSAWKQRNGALPR